MPKKRRSLQSLFIPSFLHFSTSTPAPIVSPAHPAPSFRRTTSAIAISQPSPPRPIQRNAPTNAHARSGSTSTPFPNYSPPPDYLLDEDPFANLTRPRTTFQSMSSTFTPPSLPQPSYSRPIPRSLLSTSRPDNLSSSVTSISLPSSATDLAIPRNPPFPNPTRRTLSSGSVHVRPAYLRPAFSHRPSLPSLNSLAQKSVMIPKVRKGKVGARLPTEPWDIDEGNESNGSISLDDIASSSRSPDYIGPAPYNPSHRDHDLPDFTHNLDFEMDSDSDLLDLYTETEPELEADSHMQHHLYKTRRPEVASHFLMGRLDEHDEPESTSYLASSPSSPPPLTRSTSSNSSSSSRLTSPSGGNWPRTPWSSIDETQSFFPKKVTDHVSYLPPLDDNQDSFAEIVSPDDTHPDHQWVVPDTNWVIPGSPNLTPTPTTFSPYDLIPPAESWVPHEPSTSAGTIRSPIRDEANKSRVSELGQRSGSPQTEMIDGSEWDDQRSSGRGYSDAWNSPTDNGGSNGSPGHGAGNGSGNGDFSGSGSGDSGQDGDDRKRPTNGRSAFSTPSASEESTEDEDTSTDDYGQESPRLLDGPSFVRTSFEKPSPQDDDIPLAQRIPTALDAQRTIQKQVRDERDQRRKQRRQQRQQDSEIRPPSLQTMMRPIVAVDLPGSQDTAIHASPSIKRPRTKTMSSSLISATAIADLTKRLLKVQDSSTQRTQHDEHLRGFSPVTKALYASPWSPSHNVVLKDQAPKHDFLREEDRESRLRHARSFHKPANRDVLDGLSGRSPSRANNRNNGDSKGGKLLSFPSDDMLGLDRLVKAQKASEESQRFGSLGSRPSTSGGRPSTGVGRSSTTVARPTTSVGRPNTSVGRSNTTTVARPSTGGERSDASGGGRPSFGEDPSLSRTSAESSSNSAQQRVVNRPPVPPLRLADVTSNVAQPSIKVPTTQQRIFIGDMQSFSMVEIGTLTSAGDVLRSIEEQGSLKQYAGSGSWMLWEIAQDFGMERPIRSFELLSDVSAMWNKDKMVNRFLLKMTPLAPILSRSAIPSSSPKHAGYVEWEVRRGKWSKRWLELREHCLWLSKRETGKAESMLCSLSTFDAYFVTRPYKSSKPFVFAVKSTDNISLFENTADYLHVFSCNQKDGDKWMEKILLARSYVLQQERTILFARSNSPGATAAPLNKGVLRANTRKPAPGHRPPQSLVQVSAPYSVTPAVPVFEPGSLLAQ